MSVRDFITRHYRHFNAATVRDAADGYIRHVDGGGRMLVTLAGAMSTARTSSGGVSSARSIASAACASGARLIDLLCRE